MEDTQSVDQLAEENALLRARLREAEETIQAIRSGEVDAFVVAEAESDRVYTLETAYRPYRLMIEHMQEGAAIVDRASTIFYANPRLAELVSLPLDSVIGSPFESLVDPGYRSGVMALLHGDIQKLEVSLPRADGVPTPVLLTARDLPGDGHIVCLMVKDLTDVALRRGLEVGIAEWQQEHQALLQADRRKDEFLAMLGHELRNPLTAIQGAVILLQTMGEPLPEASRACTIIARQVEQLSRMVDDLLDAVRFASGKIELQLQTIDLAQLMRDCVDSMTQAGRTTQHELELHLESVFVEADPARMEQVLDNLVGNALRYTPPGGHVRVSLEQRGQQAILEVADTGIGITPELLPQVFDLFAQGQQDARRPNAGLGIGLTLVHRIVALHGGSVSARSAGSGLGSTFTVSLPVATGLMSSDKASTVAASLGRRVIIVEDHDDSREMLCLLLEAHGHEIIATSDGVSAMEAASRFEPDLMLIDLGLPVIDGCELAQRIRQATWGAKLTLVALTGYGRPHDRQRALEAGFDSHLTKPLSARKLDELFRDLSPSS